MKLLTLFFCCTTHKIDIFQKKVTVLSQLNSWKRATRSGVWICYELSKPRLNMLVCCVFIKKLFGLFCCLFTFIQFVLLGRENIKHTQFILNPSNYVLAYQVWTRPGKSSRLFWPTDSPTIKFIQKSEEW